MVIYRASYAQVHELWLATKITERANCLHDYICTYIYIYIYAIYMLYIIYIYTHTHNSFTIIFFLTFYSPVYLTLGLLKVGLSHSKQIYFLCFNESPLKMINLNALLVLKIFKVLIKTLWTTKNDLFKNETYI